VTDDRQTGPQQRAPETVIARLRPHGRALVWPCVLLVVVAGATGYLAGRFAVLWIDVGVLVVAGLLLIAGFLLPLLRWATTTYTITTRRVVLRSGVIAHTRQELLHSRGYDVSVHRSGLQRIAGSGDVRIGGADNPLVLRDVPKPLLVSDALHDLMESNASALSAYRHEERMRRSGELGPR
jgi:uncharacterized membrane protein YdbT with pleckstrin-like domain